MNSFRLSWRIVFRLTVCLIIFWCLSGSLTRSRISLDAKNVIKYKTF